MANCDGFYFSCQDSDHEQVDIAKYINLGRPNIKIPAADLFLSQRVLSLPKILPKLRRNNSCHCPFCPDCR